MTYTSGFSGGGIGISVNFPDSARESDHQQDHGKNRKQRNGCHCKRRQPNCELMCPEMDAGPPDSRSVCTGPIGKLEKTMPAGLRCDDTELLVLSDDCHRIVRPCANAV